jgi:hypothetical protein
MPPVGMPPMSVLKRMEYPNSSMGIAFAAHFRVLMLVQAPRIVHGLSSTARTRDQGRARETSTQV